MRFFVVGAVVALAACGSDVTPEEQTRLDEKAIAEVEASQIPPADLVEPQTLSQTDFEEHDMYGVGCGFVPEGGGEDPIAVTFLDDAYMKIDDSIERFAPDPGSTESVFGTRVRFDGARHSMQLDLTDREGEQVGMETMAHDARLTMRDGRDRVVYEARGKATCGS